MEEKMYRHGPSASNTVSQDALDFCQNVVGGLSECNGSEVEKMRAYIETSGDRKKG